MPVDPSVAITIGGILCEDEDAEETLIVRGASSAERKIVCAWSERIALAAYLAGGSIANGVITTRSAPTTYPDAPWMVVKSLKSEGIGTRLVGTSGMVAYDLCRWHVTYGNKENDLGAGNEVGSLSLDISAEVLSAPRDEPTFKWKSDSKDVTPEATPAITISTANFTRARRDHATIPVATILALLDNVNGSTFEGADKGKIIYRGCSSYRKLTTLGSENWDLVHKFQYRSVPWNYFLRPSSGQWEEIVYKNGGGKLFPEGNLALLYRD